MSWPATSRYQLDAAPGSLAFVQDFVNSIPAGKPRSADLLAGLPDAQAWLDDAIARWRQSRGVAANATSADGLRFVDSVRSVQAGPNPRCFGVGRGVPRFEDSCDEPQLQAQTSWVCSRFLARDARRLATLPHVRTSCQAPLLFLEPS